MNKQSGFAKKLLFTIFGGIFSQTSLACGLEDYTGSVCLTAASYCPQGKLEANGQVLQINQYQQLYQLLSTNYGGDGVTTFNLPDLRGRSPIGFFQSPVLSGVENLKRGQAIGNSSAILSVAQLPAHDHLIGTVGTPMTVNVEVKASTALADSAAPSATSKYIAGTNMIDPGSTGVVSQNWASALTAPVTVGGVSAAVQGRTESSGGGQKISTQSPSLGMLYCIETRGIYPIENK